MTRKRCHGSRRVNVAHCVLAFLARQLLYVIVLYGELVFSRQAAVIPETPALPKLPIDSGHPSTPGVGSELELRKGDSMSER